MDVYSHPISIRYVPRILICLAILTITFVSKPVLADWSKCAVDVPDAACHWYVMAPDNTFGKGFSWKNAPWFDANGLKDISKIKKLTVLEELQASSSST